MPRSKRREVRPEPESDDDIGSVDEELIRRGSMMSTGQQKAAATLDKTRGLLYEPEVLDAVFKGLPVGCILLDSKGVVSAFSAGAERQFLFKAWEVQGENVIVLMPDHVGIRHDFYLSRCRTRIESQLSQAYAKFQAAMNPTDSDSESEEEEEPLDEPVLSKDRGDKKDKKDKKKDKKKEEEEKKEETEKEQVKKKVKTPQPKEEEPAEEEIRQLSLNDVRYGEEELQTFAAETIGKMLMFGGAAREVGAIDKAGKGFPIEVQVFSVLVKGALYFMGFSSDLRAVSEFQLLTVTQEQLLESLLDERTVARIMSGERKIFDNYDHVTVAMISIYNYQEKASKLKQDHAVELLMDVFRIIDKLLMAYPIVSKIKSHGDCLMLASGIPVEGYDSTTILVDMCSEILQALAMYNHRVQNGQTTDTLLYSRSEMAQLRLEGSRGGANDWRRAILPVTVTIGIHFGPCIGGVMSRLKGFYDLTGECVSWANRLNETCPENSIQLSEAAWNELPEEVQLDCERRTGVDLLGIGRRMTYVLQ